MERVSRERSPTRRRELRAARNLPDAARGDADGCRRLFLVAASVVGVLWYARNPVLAGHDDWRHARPASCSTPGVRRLRHGPARRGLTASWRRRRGSAERLGEILKAFTSVKAPSIPRPAEPPVGSIGFADVASDVSCPTLPRPGTEAPAWQGVSFRPAARRAWRWWVPPARAVDRVQLLLAIVRPRAGKYVEGPSTELDRWVRESLALVRRSRDLGRGVLDNILGRPRRRRMEVRGRRLAAPTVQSETAGATRRCGRAGVTVRRAAARIAIGRAPSQDGRFCSRLGEEGADERSERAVSSIDADAGDELVIATV